MAARAHPAFFCPPQNPSAAARLSAADKGLRGLPPSTTKNSIPTRRLKPSAAARPSAAEKGASGGSPPTTTQQRKPTRGLKPSAAARPRAAVKGVRGSPLTTRAAVKGSSGVSLNYDNPTRTHANEGQADRSGQAERSGKGGSGVSSATVQLARTPKKAEPSAAARPSASVKGASPLDYDTTQHAYAHNETKRSGEAKKSSEGLP
jgi:hypothetical protein